MFKKHLERNNHTTILSSHLHIEGTLHKPRVSQSSFGFSTSARTATSSPSTSVVASSGWGSKFSHLLLSSLAFPKQWNNHVFFSQLSKTEHTHLTSYGNHLASPSVASSPASSSGSDSSAGGGKAGKPLRTWDDRLYREGPPTKTSCGPAYTSRLAS